MLSDEIKARYLLPVRFSAAAAAAAAGKPDIIRLALILPLTITSDKNTTTQEQL